MTIFLLLAAIIMLACVALNKLSSRLGIPMLLAFILLGMTFGSDGIFKIEFEDYFFAEEVCSIALIFIMFYGGFGTNWKQARPVAVPAALLSSVGVILTSGMVGVFCHFVLKMDWMKSFLMGSVIGSTDAASVFSILRSKKLGLKYGTASLLELESGSNDPFSYMLTSIFISIIRGDAVGSHIAYLVFAQLVYGVVFGTILAFAASRIIKKISFASAGFDAVFVTAVALLAYAVPSAIGGNGYLSAYIVGIALGNTDFRVKKTLVPFFDGFTGMMQMLIFFLLGLLSFPSKLPQIALPAFAIALFLTFIARPLMVWLLMSPFSHRYGQCLTVSWAGFRGAASIVFAIMAMRNVEAGFDIFHTVYFIVLFSILLQGSLLPKIAKKLGMIDLKMDVMKTFSDYSEEVPVQFIQFTVTQEHPWCGMEVREMILPPETLFAIMQRGDERIIPQGSTVLEAGDRVILSARSPEKIEGIFLVEERVPKGGELAGQQISDLRLDGEALIVLIIRGTKLIIPNGSTKICEEDVLVINLFDRG